MSASVSKTAEEEEDEVRSSSAKSLVHLNTSRLTIFEREEIVKDMTPTLIAAVQRELRELRNDLEDQHQRDLELWNRRLHQVLNASKSG